MLKEETKKRYRILFSALLEQTTFNLREWINKEHLSGGIMTFLKEYSLVVQVIGSSTDYTWNTHHIKFVLGLDTVDKIVEYIIENYGVFVIKYDKAAREKKAQINELKAIIAKYESEREFLVDKRTIIAPEEITLKTLPQHLVTELATRYTQAVSVAALTGAPVDKVFLALLATM